MGEDALDRAFVALADRTRRGVVERLRAGPCRAGALAAALAASAPALTRHLRILRDSELVEEQPDPDDGRARVYSLRQEAFGRLQHWVDDVQALWQQQLAAVAAQWRKRTRGKP